MKKKDIATGAALQDYVRQKVAAGEREFQLHAEIYNSVILTREITRANDYVESAWAGLQSHAERIEQCAANWDYRKIQEVIKDVDGELSQLRRARKNIEEKYVVGNTLAEHREKIAAKTAEISGMYDDFNAIWKPQLAALLLKKDWTGAARRLHELPASPLRVTIDKDYFTAASKLNDKNDEIIEWKKSIREQIPKQSFLTVSQEVGKEKMVALRREVHEELKKYQERVIRELTSDSPDDREFFRHEIPPELIRLQELEKTRQQLQQQLDWIVKDLAELAQAAQKDEAER